MPRFHNINGAAVQFTEAEETARDSEEAAHEAAKPARAMSNLRRKRDNKLVASDWTQSNDSPLSDEVKATWRSYRQELRDLPATHSSDPDAAVWPDEPE